MVWSYLYQVLHDIIERNPAIIPIKYEQLCVDPISTYKNLYRQLEIPWDTVQLSIKWRSVLAWTIKVDPWTDFPCDEALSKALNETVRVLLKLEKSADGDEINTIGEITEPIASKFYGHNDW